MEETLIFYGIGSLVVLLLLYIYNLFSKYHKNSIELGDAIFFAIFSWVTVIMAIFLFIFLTVIYLAFEINESRIDGKIYSKLNKVFKNER